MIEHSNFEDFVMTEVIDAIENADDSLHSGNIANEDKQLREEIEQGLKSKGDHNQWVENIQSRLTSCIDSLLTGDKDSLFFLELYSLMLDKNHVKRVNLIWDTQVVAAHLANRVLCKTTPMKMEELEPEESED
jgi:hypothetical protein